MKKISKAIVGSLLLLTVIGPTPTMLQASDPEPLSIQVTQSNRGLTITLSVLESSVGIQGVFWNEWMTLILGQGTVEISQDATIVFSSPSGPIPMPKRENGRLSYSVAIGLGHHPGGFNGKPGLYRVRVFTEKWQSGYTEFKYEAEPKIISYSPHVFSPAAESQDAIDLLTTELSSNPLWMNGTYPSIKLSEKAKHDEVIAECIKLTGFDKGYVKDFKIIKINKVKIRGRLPEDYFAALMDTDLGKKIVLFRYENLTTGWWTRVYDSK